MLASFKRWFGSAKSIQTPLAAIANDDSVAGDSSVRIVHGGSVHTRTCHPSEPLAAPRLRHTTSSIDLHSIVVLTQQQQQSYDTRSSPHHDRSSNPSPSALFAALSPRALAATLAAARSAVLPGPQRTSQPLHRTAAARGSTALQHSHSAHLLQGQAPARRASPPREAPETHRGLPDPCVSDPTAQLQHTRALRADGAGLPLDAAANLEVFLSAPPNPTARVGFPASLSSVVADRAPHGPPLPHPPTSPLAADSPVGSQARPAPGGSPAGDRSGLAAHANTGADTGLQQQAQQREQPSRASEGQQQAPAAASEPSKVLAVGRALPPGMRRAEWGMSDFVLSKRLYRGSRSAVYKATCLRSGMPVALKVYFLSRVPTNVIHQLNREVQIHSELQHRGVLMLYAAFQDSKRLVLVSEYAARGDLFNLQCALDRPMTEEELRDVVLEPLLDALSYLHGKGICHRDIKPENLLYTSDWGLRVADFGVSINLLEERAVTRAGTTDYMAPEVVRCPLKAMPNDNKHDQALAYTTAADVWSVGVLAYELLVGFPPVVGDAAGGGVPGFDNSTLSFPANVSAGVRDLITATLARQPEDRPTVRQLQRHPWLAGGAAAAPSGAAAVGAAAAGAAAAGAAAAGAAAAGAAAEAAVEAVAEMAAEVAAEVTAGAAVGAAVAAEVAAGAAVGAAAEMAADGAAKVAAEAAAGEEAEGAAGAAAGAAMAARGTEAQ